MKSKIVEMYPLLNSSQYSNLFKLRFRTGDFDILDNYNLCTLLINKYASWTYNNLLNQELSDNVRSFVHIWSIYRDLYIDDLQKIYDGFHLEYNPIENYDRYEITTIDDEYGQKKERVEKDVDTSTNDATSDSVTNPTITNTSKTTGFNSENFANDGETTTSYDANTVNNIGQRKTTNTYGDINRTNMAYDDKHTTNSHVHGNIGVTTNAQMLTQEIAVRMQPYVESWIDRFIKQYCYYVEGDD